MFKVHWPLVAEMVERCGVSVTVPLYPVVPEAPHSAQDAVADAAFAKLAETVDPSRIILNGDSAGAHMALALALRLARAARETGGPQPGKLALFAPWLDLTLADPEIYRTAGAEVANLKARLEALETELEEAYLRWEELDAIKG
jgi:acetyl esterase/lipase